MNSAHKVTERFKVWNHRISEMEADGFESLMVSRKRDVNSFFNNISHDLIKSCYDWLVEKWREKLEDEEIPLSHRKPRNCW